VQQAGRYARSVHTFFLADISFQVKQVSQRIPFARCISLLPGPSTKLVLSPAHNSFRRISLKVFPALAQLAKSPAITW
jgi:hypothetical protein